VATRTQQRRRQEQARRQRRLVSLAAGGVVLVLVALVAGRLLSSAAPASVPDSPAPPEVLADQARAIVGSANVLAAAICGATDNTPAEVCSQPAVQSIQAELAASPAPARAS
jgi:hypothetical protein